MLFLECFPLFEIFHNKEKFNKINSTSPTQYLYDLELTFF